mgnify:CR=1 FL=1
MKLGYACINSTLQQTGGITTNRGMRQKTFNEKGLNYVSELALQNCRDLVNIVKWNEFIFCLIWFFSFRVAF